MPLIVITCESCGSQFRLDSARLTKPQNKVRCAKCKHVFEVERPDEDSLIYIEVSEGESGLIPAITRKEDSAPPPPPPSLSAPSRAKRSAAKIAMFIAVPIVVLVAAFFFLRSQTSLLGGLAEKEPKEPQRPTVTLLLDTVQAYYLENVHSGQVLVIEGEVLNESSRPVSFVLIEGKLYGNDKVAQTQRCYAGNSMTRKDITNLKTSEIQDRMGNREGKNLKNVRIPSATKVPFVLVFHNLPEMSTLSNYTVDVISSKFD